MPSKSRDRVQELIRVKASDLRASAENWRQHPDGQRAAMRAILGEVGYVSGLIAFRNKKGQLTLIDGHLRQEISGDEMVPVQVVDLTEVEARKVLATYDPVGALATANTEAAEALIKSLRFKSEAINGMLAGLRGAQEIEKVIEDTLLDQAVQLRPEREYVVVMCDADDGVQWDQLRDLLGLKLVRRGGYKKGSEFDQTGVERVIPAAALIQLIQGKRGKHVDRDSVDGASGQGAESGVIANGVGVRPGGRKKGLRSGGDKKRGRRPGKRAGHHGNA